MTDGTIPSQGTDAGQIFQEIVTQKRLGSKARATIKTGKMIKARVTTKTGKTIGAGATKRTENNVEIGEMKETEETKEA